VAPWAGIGRARWVGGDPMNRLTRVRAAAGRGAAWLLPAGRRDWVAAVWAEAHEVPPGLTRLAWRAGGVWVLAREALLPRRLVRAVLFAAAGAGAAWVAWPQPGDGHVAEGRFNAIAPVLLILGYAGVTLFLTSRRSQVTRSTLVTGTGTGLLFGVVMYAVDPLGLSTVATNPWLPGSTADPLVTLAWILLFGGPAAAAVLANGTAAMAVTTLGTGTTMLMLKSPWLLHWLNHGRHLTAFATYRYELYTTNHTGTYVLMLMFFPVIGLITSYLAAVIANPAPLDARSPGPGLPMTPGE